MTHRRRAPRLGPDDSIARHFTRSGRFRRIDPRRGRRPPGLAKVVGAIAWAVLLEESLRRAWQAHHAEDPQPG